MTTVEAARRRLVGVDFEDDGVLWRVYDVRRNSALQRPMVYYHRVGVDPTVDYEFSTVQEVETWVAATVRRTRTFLVSGRDAQGHAVDNMRLRTAGAVKHALDTGAVTHVELTQNGKRSWIPVRGECNDD